MAMKLKTIKPSNHQAKNEKTKKRLNDLTLSDVQHVAQLANLPLTNKELKLFQTQLSDILKYIDQLQEVNTEGVEPTSQVTGLTNVLREDILTDSLTQTQALSNAPKTKNGYILVPGILKA